MCSFCPRGDVYAKGFCRNCYERQLRSGTPEYQDLLPKVQRDYIRAFTALIRSSASARDQLIEGLAAPRRHRRRAP